jgi:hypothetical protein
VAVQVLVVVPQPLLRRIEDFGSNERLPLTTLGVSGPVPVITNVTALAAPPSVIVWLAPPVRVTAGGAGLVTVTANVADAKRFPPSVALTVTFAVPIWPSVGVIVRSHAFVVMPHP